MLRRPIETAGIIGRWNYARQDAGQIFIILWLPFFVISPIPYLLIFYGKRFFVLWGTHRNVDEVSFPVGGIGFPRFHQRADVPTLDACIHHPLSVDLGEHEVGVSENVVRG